MSEPVINTEAIARWWELPPAHRMADPTRSLDAAIWAGGPQEIWAEPDPDIFVVAMPIRPYRCTPYMDGKAIERPVWRPGMTQIVRPGIAPRAVIRDRFEMLQVYLPNRVVRAALDEIGRPEDR